MHRPGAFFSRSKTHELGVYDLRIFSLLNYYMRMNEVRTPNSSGKVRIEHLHPKT